MAKQKGGYRRRRQKGRGAKLELLKNIGRSVGRSLWNVTKSEGKRALKKGLRELPHLIDAKNKREYARRTAQNYARSRAKAAINAGYNRANRALS